MRAHPVRRAPHVYGRNQARAKRSQECAKHRTAISLAAHLLTAHPTPARPYGPAHEQPRFSHPPPPPCYHYSMTVFRQSPLSFAFAFALLIFSIWFALTQQGQSWVLVLLGIAVLTETYFGETVTISSSQVQIRSLFYRTRSLDISQIDYMVYQLRLRWAVTAGQFAAW